MNYKLLMNTAVLAGEIMLKSGAETYRVEDTVKHILRTAHTETADTIVLMTGFVATLDNPDMDTITIIRRVEHRGTNLNQIDRVNEVSRQYCSGNITLEQAYDELNNIKHRQYKSWEYNLATVFLCAGFAPLFGGKLPEIAGSAFVGMVLALVVTIGKRLRMNGFIQDIISSAVIAVTAMGLQYLFASMNVNTVIISAIMPLVPGVAITNAIRDTLQGDYLSGAARMLEAFLIAAGIALGVGVGIALFGRIYWGGV